MPPVANLPKDLKGVGYQTLNHVNSHTVIGYRLTGVASCQVIRDLIVLFIVTGLSILKIGLRQPLLAGKLLANTNCNMPLVLERDPPTHVVVGPPGHGFGHLAAIPWPSLAMPNEVAWRAHLAV